MSNVSEQERNAFFRKHFGASGNKPFKEERKSSGGYLVSIGHRPVRPKGEYRSAHRVGTAAWIRELERGGWPQD